MTRIENAGRTRDEWDELEAALKETQEALDAMTDDWREADERADMWEDRADAYKRQLGGTNAALNRCRHEVRELRDENKRLLNIGIAYRDKCEEYAAAFRKLTGDPLTALEELVEGRSS